jgi:electron transfer flavoprotein alpha subunit
LSVLVLAEHDGIQINVATRQTIGAAKFWKSPINVLIVGHKLESVIASVKKLDGVTGVLIAEAPFLGCALAEDVAPIIAELGKRHSIIVAAHTSFSRNILPRAAALLDVAMISEVLEILDVNTFIRPIYAGNLLSTVESSDPIQILTVRGSRFEPVKHCAEGEANVEYLCLNEPTELTRWISKKSAESARPELSSARIVVSGGRSLGSAENFETVLAPLADLLNGSIGATRSAVDAGYAPNDIQIGQTGTIVAPDLYFAMGISGAIQHAAGMKDSKIVVAVNLDPDAPIFKIADYGLIGDLFEIVPALTEALS